jgi:predicted GTPase
MKNKGAKTKEEFAVFLRWMGKAFDPYPELREASRELFRLADSVEKPFSLAVFGRMKTGKSTLINALIGRQLAITGVEEATATINRISYGTRDEAARFLVHWRNGKSQSLPVDRLGEWAGKSDEVIERVRETAFLQLYAEIEQLRKVEIIDTPGTGSVVEDHENVARKFLDPRASERSTEEGRNADALLYVFPPVAREHDEESLAEFESTRLPGSDPYNSIGVLHKWDHLPIDDARSKADRIARTFSGTVASVIPVSGPLALAAREAPDEFFESLLRVLPETTRDLQEALKLYTRWDKIPERKQCRLSYRLPWLSFKRIAELAAREAPSDVAVLRGACLRES